MLFVFLEVLFFLKAQDLCTYQPLLSVGRAAGWGPVSVTLGFVSLSLKLQTQSLSLSFGKDFSHVVHLWESWAFISVWFILSSIGKVIAVPPHTLMCTHTHVCSHTQSNRCVNFTLVNMGALGTLRSFLRSF